MELRAGRQPTDHHNCCNQAFSQLCAFSSPLSGSKRAMAMFVRRDSAVKLVDDLAGESPASADYLVGTVVISGDGAGDQTVGSPEVNVLVGWMRIRSAPNRRASKATGCSASEP